MINLVEILRVCLRENLEEEYPASFNMEEFKKITSFKKRLQYCNEHLQRLSSGSSRAVYKIDEEKVLKLAMNNKGLAQNEEEIKLSGYYDLKGVVANVFDYEPNNLWLEMELAEKLTASDFKRITGFSFKDYAASIHNYYNFTLNNSKYSIRYDVDKEVSDKMWDEDFISSVLHFIGDYGVPVGDFGRLSSYGVVKNKGKDAVVIIDYGLSEEIHKKHYSNKRLKVR
jgi:hypothetical protein